MARISNTLPSKKIILPYGKARLLAKDFDVHEVTIGNALKFKYDTELARKIQRKAITDYGGKPIGISVLTILKF